MSALRKLKYDKQNIIEHLLLLGSETRLNQIVTKPQHVPFLRDMFYLMYNHQCTPVKFEEVVFIPNSSEE